jgi:hypothetical protein
MEVFPDNHSKFKEKKREKKKSAHQGGRKEVGGSQKGVEY